jgi:hypothetical protein
LLRTYNWDEFAKANRREAAEAEATTLQVKQFRVDGDSEALNALNRLLGVTLGSALTGKRIDFDAVKRELLGAIRKQPPE